MHNSFVLGISVGESFAEYSLLENSKPCAQKRVFLSRETLKASLLQFVNEHADKKIENAFVSLRIPRRLLDYHFSGAVAHIATDGFEHWLSLTDSPKNLTNKDLLFSVQERVLANGKVEKAVTLEDLEAIAAKLNMIECKKVCLHFLHSDKNPENLLAAKAFLEEKKLVVFTPPPTEGTHEVERWNKNALNATVTSVFNDRREEILQALEGAIPTEKIFFLDSVGRLHHSALSPNLESFFSASTALGLAFGKEKKADVLHLGLEGFLLISSTEWDSTWTSAWGPVDMRHLRTQHLGIQPTLGVHMNIFGHFDFSATQEGWEPGPMFLGRGQKLTLLDLWAENTKLTKLQGLEDRFVPQGIQRFKNSLFALSKISRTRDSDLGQISKELQSLTLQRLAMEAFLHRNSEKLHVTGPLASVFANAFKKDIHTTIDADEFGESHATALWGSRALGDTL